MRIRLIKQQTVLDFANKHAGSKFFFDKWLEKLKIANWAEPGDIKDIFNSADLLGEGVTGSSLILEEIITGSFASISLVTIWSICLFAGLDHMRIMISFAERISSILLIYIE